MNTRNAEQSHVEVPYAAATDLRISLRALGMLTFLLTVPHDRRMQFDDLLGRAGNAERDALRMTVRELREAGYVAPADPAQPGAITLTAP